MKNSYSTVLKFTILTAATLLLFAQQQIQAQACSTAQGNQTAYGTNNVWIGYIYTGQSFNTYQGYTNEGTAASSTDGDNFQDIATISAINTNSTSEEKFAYTDQFTYNGDVYYRLQLVDRDGSINYSGIVNLPMQTSNAVRIYPTMVENGQLTIETPAEVGQARLELFDMTGRRLMVQNWSQLQGRQQVSITANSRLTAGAYIVRLSDAQSVIAKQIIIIK